MCFYMKELPAYLLCLVHPISVAIAGLSELRRKPGASLSLALVGPGVSGLGQAPDSPAGRASEGDTCGRGEPVPPLGGDGETAAHPVWVRERLTRRGRGARPGRRLQPDPGPETRGLVSSAEARPLAPGGAGLMDTRPKPGGKRRGSSGQLREGLGMCLGWLRTIRPIVSRAERPAEQRHHSVRRARGGRPQGRSGGWVPLLSASPGSSGRAGPGLLRGLFLVTWPGGLGPVPPPHTHTQLPKWGVCMTWAWQSLWVTCTGRGLVLT